MLKNLVQHHISNASILLLSDWLIVNVSKPCRAMLKIRLLLVFICKVFMKYKKFSFVTHTHTLFRKLLLFLKFLKLVEFTNLQLFKLDFLTSTSENKIIKSQLLVVIKY